MCPPGCLQTSREVFNAIKADILASESVFDVHNLVPGPSPEEEGLGGQDRKVPLPLWSLCGPPCNLAWGEGGGAVPQRSWSPQCVMRCLCASFLKRGF